MSTQNKLAVISRSFPPVMSGSPVLMNNLFQDYPYPIKGIIGRYLVDDNEFFKAPCDAFYLKLPFQGLEELMFRYPYIFKPFIKRFIKKCLEEIKPKAAYIAYPTGYYLSYAAEVCLELGIPYLVHMHDLWEENMKENSYEAKLAKEKEAFLLNKASKVLCMTTTQQDFYKRKHGIDSFYLPHTIPAKRLNEVKSVKFKSNSARKKRILYSGSVDRLINQDAIQQFVKCIDYLPEDYEITMLINVKDPLKKKLGIYHPRVIYDWVNPEAAFKLQQSYDLLFLPLSVNNGSNDEVRTVFATKTLDYLVSGTPIFCLAPKNSFHSIDAKAKAWAEVINDDDPAFIASKMVSLLNDVDRQKVIVENAFIEARNRASEIYVEKLYYLIDSI